MDLSGPVLQSESGMDLIPADDLRVPKIFRRTHSTGPEDPSGLAGCSKPKKPPETRNQGFRTALLWIWTLFLPLFTSAAELPPPPFWGGTFSPSEEFRAIGFNGLAGLEAVHGAQRRPADMEFWQKGGGKVREFLTQLGIA